MTMKVKRHVSLINSIPQGTPVQIEGLNHYVEKMIFLGSILFVSSKFIRIKVPNDEKIVDFLKRKPDLIVRFKKGGYLCQFETSPYSFESYPFCVIQITIPDQIHTFSSRKNERIKVSVDCKIRFYQMFGIKKNDLIKATIRDLSVNGVKISTPMTPVNKFLLVSDVNLPDGTSLKPIDGKIKNTKREDKNFLLSVHFIYISDSDKNGINFFILKNLQQDNKDKIFVR